MNLDFLWAPGSFDSFVATIVSKGKSKIDNWMKQRWSKNHFSGRRIPRYRARRWVVERTHF